MDVNSFTHRAAEALATAQREARSSDHQRIEPEHLLVALLADPEGVVYPVVRRAGADPGMLKARWAASSSGPARRPATSATSTCPPSTCCWP
jgi:ATP-dependent Clp protease ATP-binding subunit ClpB